ncbi:hypothetical protein TRVL_05282 [Trypanosoma vivax]|nr:hypothetical protein TRVL_05282 [Trypanosoma vivax]
MSRRTPSFTEDNRGNNIKVVLKTGQQNKRNKRVIEHKLEELRQKRETALAQAAVEAEPRDAGRNAVDGTSVTAESPTSEKAFNVGFDGLDNGDEADDSSADELDGLDFDTSSVGGMRSAVSSGTIALVFLLPNVIIAVSFIARFVLRRKSYPINSDPPT